MTPVEITTQRLMREEGRKPRAYNDATGKTVTCQPEGNLSIGYGINLENGLDEVEMAWLLGHRIGLVEAAVRSTPAYLACDPTQASVLLDIGYNNGVHGLMGYKRMLAACERRDWAGASAECTTSNPALKGRYALLAHLLLTGSGT